MRVIYNFLVYIVLIISPLIIIYRIFKKKENPKRFLEKFSLQKDKRKVGKLIWFHCSSVGELLSIVPLIQELEKTKNSAPTTLEARCHRAYGVTGSRGYGVTGFSGGPRAGQNTVHTLHFYPVPLALTKTLWQRKISTVMEYQTLL